MSTDVTYRLDVVVNLYERYIDLIKEYNNNEIAA